MADERKVSRRGFIKGAAVIGAVAASGGLLSHTTAQAAGVPTKWDREADVVVAGTGAGLMAAVHAVDAGAKVLVLEKTKVLGGSTAASGGVIYAAESSVQKAAGIKDSKDTMFEDWMRATYNEADPALVRMIADNAADIVEWFATHGCQFPTDEASLYQSGPDKIRRGHTVKERIGDAYTQVLAKYVKDKGVTILTEHRAVHLITDASGQVVGLVAQTADGKEVNIAAKKAVVLATGGYAEDRDLLREMMPATSKDLFIGPSGTSVGDGLRMAQTLGADVATQYYHSDPLGIILLIVGAVKAGWYGLKIQNSLTAGYPPTYKMAPGSFIYVNKNGLRYVNDVDFYKTITLATYQQPDVATYMIFDESLRKDERFTLGIGWTRDDVTNAIEKGWIQKADTLEDLANKLGISQTGLKDTVTKYNADVKAGKDSQFGRPSATLKSLETGPFYGVACKVGFLPSGGIRVNTKAQVLRRDRTVIPRLYCCGAAEMGGVINTGYPGSGSYLAAGFTFGMVAGQTAAAEKPWDAKV